MKKLIALLLLAIVMAFSFGIVACGGEPESEVEKPEPEEQFNPEEKVLPLAKAVIGKVDDVFTQDAFKYTLKRDDLSKTLVVEKDAGGFVAYQSGVNVYSSNAYEDLKDMYAELTGKTFSEDVSIMLEKFNPFYLFNKNDKYYMWTSTGNGELSKAQYDEILSGVTLTDPAFAGLFDPDNFKLSNIGERNVVMEIAGGKTITIGDNAVTSAMYVLNLDEPRLNLSIEVNEKLYTFAIDYVSTIQEFVDFYTTEHFSLDFKNPSADFTINYVNLTELHESKRDADAEISATLPLDMHLTLAKISKSNFRLKITTIQEDSKYGTEKNETVVVYKDNKVSSSASDLEYYFDPATKQVTRKVADKYMTYTATAEQVYNINKAIPVLSDDFFKYLSGGFTGTESEGYKQYWYYEIKDNDGNNIYFFGNPTSSTGRYAKITYEEGKITLKFEGIYQSGGAKNSYIYEFDQIGTAELTIPTVTGITPADFLSQMETQGAYTMGAASGNNNLYKSIRIDHGQGDVGESQSIYNKDGKYYVVEYYSNMSGNVRYYEIDEDTYDKLLPTNNYWYSDFFDANNYTVSGNTIAFNSDKYQGTVEFSSTDMIINLSNVNAFGFKNDKVVLSLDSVKIRWHGNLSSYQYEVIPASVDTFNQEAEDSDNQFYASYSNGEIRLAYEYKDNFVYDDNNNWYFVEENGVEYKIESTYGIISAADWVKMKSNERVDISDKFVLVDQVLENGDFEHVSLNKLIGHDDEGNEVLVTFSIDRYDGNIYNYYTFTFSDNESLTIRFYKITKTVPTEKVKVLKTLDEIKAEIEANNFLMSSGDVEVYMDGKNSYQYVPQINGYAYVIYDGTEYKAYMKTLNSNGIFTVGAPQTTEVHESTLLKDLVNSGLVQTKNFYLGSWYEWENKNVEGIDGVDSVKFIINDDGSYTIIVNGDTESQITLSKVGQVNVDIPSNDAMTLFVESLLFHKDFTWETEGYFSDIYASYPGVEALAGAKFLDFTMKSDNDTKFKYSSTMYHSALDAIAPPGSDPTPDQYTEMYAKREEVGGTLYAKPQGASQWTTSTATQEQFDVLFAQGISEKDLLTLFDASKYTNNGDGTYTLNGTVQWRGTGDEPVDLTNVTVTVTNSTMVLSGSAQIAGMLVDLDYTFYNLNSTSVTLPIV